jgi:hypothetical protein
MWLKKAYEREIYIGPSCIGQEETCCMDCELFNNFIRTSLKSYQCLKYIF